MSQRELWSCDRHKLVWDEHEQTFWLLSLKRYTGGRWYWCMTERICDDSIAPESTKAMYRFLSDYRDSLGSKHESCGTTDETNVRTRSDSGCNEGHRSDPQVQA